MKLTLFFSAIIWTSLALSANEGDGEFNLIRISDREYLNANKPNLYIQIDRSANYSNEKIEKNVFVVDNLPRIRNLDGKGLCSACGPATLIQKMDCDIKKIKNCSDKNQVPNKELVNLMGIYAYNDHSTTAILEAKGGKYNAKNGLIKQKYLPDVALDFRGGDSYNILKNIEYSGFELTTESCYPFDQFANSTEFQDQNRKGTFDAKKTDPLFNALEKQYNEARAKLKMDKSPMPDIKEPMQANLICNDCLTELQTKLYDLGKIQEEAKILESLKDDKFETFLYSALFSNCYDQLKKFPRPKQILKFPEQPSELTYNDFTSKITEIIRQKKPIILRNACGVESKMDNEICLDSHATTITGIKDVCERNNPGNCKQYFRIQECYGEDWREVNGEWFEAEQIIKQIIPENPDVVEIGGGKLFSKFKRRSSPNQKIRYDQAMLIWLDY